MRSAKYFAILLSKFSTLLFLTNYAAYAAGSDSKSANQILNGSVQDKEKMEASVKLLLAPPPALNPLPAINQMPLRSNVEQFSGSAQYSPRNPGSAIPMIAPHSNVPRIFQTGTRTRFHHRFSNPISDFTPVETVTPGRAQWSYTATPRNGLMTWSPGYATKRVQQPTNFLSSTHLGFSSQNRRFLKEQRAQASVMTYATPPPAPRALQAVQQALPIKHAPPPANWNLWYERVAKAVYGQWTQNTSLGPGKALLQLTVYASRNVAVKVVDFTEAPGAAPNAPRETRFREASLKAINVLDGADVWTFPASAGDLKNVTFDMELKHAVGESPGCSVVRMHTD